MWIKITYINSLLNSRNPNDERHYRATVIDLNEDSKEAVVFLIDYAERVVKQTISIFQK